MATDRPHHITFSGDPLLALSATRIVDKLRAREVSPRELIEMVAKRIDDVDPAINATPILCLDRARNAAVQGEVDHPGHLAGLPVPIKDLSAVEGVRTTYGTPGLADFVPDASDPVVQRLESRGAVVIGKSNTPEFGAGANTFNAVLGTTRNPWDTRMNAGGSSGGAAASLAAGTSWLAHGSDHAGSLRTPASYCGIVGLRPSPGRVPPSKMTAAFMREGVEGPMARSVEDCALFLDAMSGYDPVSPLSHPAPPTPYLDSTRAIPKSIRIAYAPTLNGYAPVESDIRALMDNAIRTAEKNGAVITDDCPDMTGVETTYRTLRGLLWATTVGRAEPHIKDHLKQTLAENIAFGQNLKLTDISDAELGRTEAYKRFSSIFHTHDVLATAVVGCKPAPVEVEFPTRVAGEEMADYISWLKFAFPATTTGLPSMSLPVGFTKEGLPTGIQLIGPPRAEDKLLQAARFIEASLDLKLGPIDPNTP